MIDNHQEHIRKIRDDSQASQRIKDSLNNSIRTLSKDLYTKDTHFVLELIQNAEDNTYRKSDPSLSFLLVKADPTSTKGSDGALIVQNNETGFSRKNVDAICAVGKTTKRKIQGYIGEKGIGFKSVFLVTTNPHIFSNGYCFCLPEHDEETGLGYIVPRWIDKVPEGVDLSQTTIILPLDKAGFGYEQIEEMLSEIEPETILFLSKLKALVIETDTGSSLTILKDGSKVPLVQILVEGNRQNEPVAYIAEFLFYNANFTKPSHIGTEHRKDIDNRDISIAFPLNEDNNNAGKIFAYLPVRSDTGLPFLINADFLLTSSREGIQEDEPWNQWLRDCVPEVFVEAFETWLDIKAYRNRIYGFIPLEAHIDFLEPIVESIQEKLKDCEIILTEPDGQKRKPELTRTFPETFRSLLSEKLYPKVLLDTRLCLSELECYQNQLKAIGVKQLTLDLVKECFQDREWIEKHDHDWLLKCYSFLAIQDFENGLTGCPIVPIQMEGETRSSCDNDQPIYFECGEEHKSILEGVPDCAKVTLAFLEKDFYSKIKEDKKILKWLTDSLRVYDFSDRNYAFDVIQWFKDHYQEIGENDIIDTTIFLSEFSGSDIDFENIPVLLADSRRMLLSKAKNLPGVQAVVAPETFDSKTGWQHLWKTMEDRNHFLALSNCYSKVACDFLIKKKLILKYPKPFFYKDGGYYNEYWDYLPPEWMKDDSYNVNNYEANALIAFFKSYSNDVNTWWDVHRSRSDGRCGFRLEKKREASIIQSLKNLRWLPTTKGFARPQQAFLPTQHIKEVLGDSVPYFSGDLPENIVELLGIRNAATVEELISVLEQQAKNGEGSKELAERLYRTLASRDLPENILRRLREGKLIYVPIDSHDRWATCKEVIWKDRKDVLGDDFIFLEKIYPKLKGFFIETLGVKEDVDTEIFARRWLNLQKESDRNPEEIESILTNIYREIRPICETDKDDRPGWWQEFIDNAKIWTQAKVFESRHLVYIPDDGDLKKIFDGNNLFYAWRPAKDSFLDWESLYRALDIKYLSESVSISLGEGLEYDIKNQNDYLTIPAKILIITWIRETRPTDYKRLLHEHVIEAFLKTNEGTGSTWKVIYHLGEKEAHKARDVVWYETENILLVTEGGDGRKKNNVALTLARDLMPNRAYKDLSDWIELVLGEKDWEWRIGQKGWHVPDEVKKWVETQVNGVSENLPASNSSDTIFSGSPESQNIQVKYDEITAETCETHQQAKQEPISTTKRIEETTSNTPEQRRTLHSFVSEQHVNIFNYKDKILDAFNRSGKVEIDETPESDQGIVSHLERRREKEAERHQDRIENEPAPQERRRKTERTILEGPDEQVRKTLGEWYGGKCQICGDTFPERDGRPFFIANYMVPRRFARQVDTYANALCLCAEHFAKWQHGAVEADDIVDQIRSMKTKAEGGAGDLQVRIKMCGDECAVKFNEKHLIALQELLNAAESVDLPDR